MGDQTKFETLQLNAHEHKSNGNFQSSDSRLFGLMVLTFPQGQISLALDITDFYKVARVLIKIKNYRIRYNDIDK
jgi:hypothetical protein